jgi:hypothetical protein
MRLHQNICVWIRHSHRNSQYSMETGVNVEPHLRGRQSRISNNTTATSRKVSGMANKDNVTPKVSMPGGIIPVFMTEAEQLI